MAEPCIEHGDLCPYGGMPECGEMVSEITSVMRRADEQFEKTGGGSRHFVRELLVPGLQAKGLKVVRTADLDKKERDGRVRALLGNAQLPATPEAWAKAALGTDLEGQALADHVAELFACAAAQERERCAKEAEACAERVRKGP